MIDKFSGEYSFLSNFYIFPIMFNGLIFQTAEHLYQWMKTDNLVWKDEIRWAETPGKAKKLGRQAPMRKGWNEVRKEVMKIVLNTKFGYSEMKKKLLKTGDEILVEGNTWGDTFWGVCNGVGKNTLGELLMEVRKEIKDKESTVVITKKEYDSLLEDRKILTALENAGVDNWEGYEEALENLENLDD